MDAAGARGVTVGRDEQMHIRLALQELAGAVVGVVVDDQEPVDAKPAVVRERRGQAQRLVAHDKTGEDRARPLLHRAPVDPAQGPSGRHRNAT